MSKEKRMAPIRRLSSRNGRFDPGVDLIRQDTMLSTTSSQNSGVHDNPDEGTNHHEHQYQQRHEEGREQTNNHKDGESSAVFSRGSSRGLDPASSIGHTAASIASPARPRRGRPKKKRSDSTASFGPADSPALAADLSTGLAEAEPLEPTATAATNEVTSNDSDEWSDDDEVHHLPNEIKAQFGNIVWAKSRGNPPWPAQIWDPRYLASASREVARLAYGSLGHNHLVKFYDNKGSFSAVPYKSITPFDPTELPSHLKACKNLKKKETLKDDVQVATDDARRSRAERIIAMREFGRSSPPPNNKKVKKPKPSLNKTASTSSTQGLASNNSMPITDADDTVEETVRREEVTTPKEPTIRRTRGRPRKNEIKELEADRPSSNSSGAEYELELPKEAVDDQVEESEETQQDAMDIDEEGEEEEEGIGIGNDDDEEEYTAEPDSDKKVLEENSVSKKAGRKRGRPRKGGGRSTGSGLAAVSVLGSESGSVTNRSRGRGGHGGEGSRDEEDDSDKKGLMPPVKEVDNAVDLVETVVEPSGLISPSPRESKEKGIDSGGSGSGGDDGSPSGCDKMEIDAESGEARQMAQGEAKARALATIQAYCASQPAEAYGRDEGWVSPEEEVRERDGDTGEGSEAVVSSESSKGTSEVPREASTEDVETRGTDDAEDVAPTSSLSSKPAAAAAEATGVKDGAMKRGRADDEKVQGEGQSRGKKQRKSKIASSHEAEMVENSSSSNGNIAKKMRLQEDQIETARKLTEGLKKASMESKFSKEDVLEVLRGLGELEESVELLQQSGCGKAVANVRKYFSGGDVKHHDRDVSTAASALRSRWMSTLGRGSQPSNTTVSSGPGGGSDPRGTASSSINGKGRGKKADAASVPSDAPASDVASVPSDTPAVSSKVSAAVPSDVPGDKAAVPRDEVVISNDKTAVSSDAPAKSVEMSEPRRRATSMLMSVLGSSTAAVQCCSAIEEELFSTQGREVGKDYLRYLRNAVFSMEGTEAQRLREKVMSEMVLPRDFVSKSCDELRALANML